MKKQLVEECSALILVIRQIADAWEKGDLAGAVRNASDVADNALDTLARASGWVWDEGGPHWFKPSEHPFHEAGQYAKTAEAACCAEGLV